MRLRVLLTTVSAAALCALLLPACEASGGGGDVAAERQQHTGKGAVELFPEEGMVLAGARKLAYGEAQTMSADLMVYAHSDTVKIEAGHPNGTFQVIKNAGGRPETVGSLEEVPNEAPPAGTRGILIDPEAGQAFLVGGNVSDGWARCRVTSGPGDGTGSLAVSIECDVTWWE